MRENAALSFFRNSFQANPVETASLFSAKLGRLSSQVDFTNRLGQIKDERGHVIDSFALAQLDTQPNKPMSGELSDTYTGTTIFYNNREEFYEAFAALEKERKQMLEERAKWDLLLASPGDPKNIESIYKSTAPDKDEDPEAYEKHMAEMKDAVKDAVRSFAGSMSLSELREFASRYQGLRSLLARREEAIKKLGLGLTQGENLSGLEIEKLQAEKNEKYSNIDVKQLASKIDSLSDRHYVELLRRIDNLDSDLKRAKDSRLSIGQVRDLRTKRQAKAREIVDWFDNLDIS